MRKLYLLFMLGVFITSCGGPPNVRFISTRDLGTILVHQDRILLSRKDIRLKTPGGREQNIPLKLYQNTFTADLGAFGEYREKISAGNSEITGEIKLSVTTDDSFMIICPFEFPKPAQAPYFMVPCFLYGTNNLESSRGRQPRLNYGGAVDYPNSSVLYTRSDRSSHPGVLVVDSASVYMVGVREILQGGQNQPENVWQPRYINTGLFLDTAHPQRDVIGYTLGYQHFPKRYTGKTNNPGAPGEDEYRSGWIHGQKDKKLTVKTFYFADFAADVRDHAKAIRAYYYQLHEKPKKRATRQAALEKITKAHVRDAWQPDKKYFYINTNVTHEGDIAWTGGMQNAYPLLKAGLRLNDKKAVQTAAEFISMLVRTGMNERAGLFYEAKVHGEWQVSGWWGYPTHSAYLNGQASYYILKCYELQGRSNPEWLAAAWRVIDTAVKGQNEAGAYAAQYNPENGKGVDYNAFQGCWFAAGAARLGYITGESRYIDSALKALEHYNTWHRRGELYGTPMDTKKAVDEEGNLAFIAACAELHKITGRKDILDMAVDGLNWEFTWKFAYNTVHSNDPLRRLEWSSCGGSVTSTHNVHIHQMGNLVAGDIYYLYTHIKDPYIADRLTDTCIWGLGTFNRFPGDFGFGGEGWATEQFFHSDGLQDNNTPWDGGVWKGHLPWASACVLLNCAEDIPGEFFGE